MQLVSNFPLLTLPQLCSKAPRNVTVLSRVMWSATSLQFQLQLFPTLRRLKFYKPKGTTEQRITSGRFPIFFSVSKTSVLFTRFTVKTGAPSETKFQTPIRTIHWLWLCGSFGLQSDIGLSLNGTESRIVDLDWLERTRP